MGEIQEQEKEFALWGVTLPFRSRFLLSIVVSLVLIIVRVDYERNKERERYWNEITACLKQHSTEIERLKNEQRDYILQVEARQREALAKVESGKTRKK